MVLTSVNLSSRARPKGRLLHLSEGIPAIGWIYPLLLDRRGRESLQPPNFAENTMKICINEK